MPTGTGHCTPWHVLSTAEPTLAVSLSPLGPLLCQEQCHLQSPCLAAFAAIALQQQLNRHPALPNQEIVGSVTNRSRKPAMTTNNCCIHYPLLTSPVLHDPSHWYSSAAVSKKQKSSQVLFSHLTHPKHGVLPWTTPLSRSEVAMELWMSKMSHVHDVEQSSPILQTSPVQGSKTDLSQHCEKFLQYLVQGTYSREQRLLVGTSLYFHIA